MYKLIVLAEPETSDGFRLAGVDVVEVREGEEARKRLRELLDDDTVGIIALSEEFEPYIDERTRSKIQKIYRPIVVNVPSKKKLEIRERAEYLRSLIKRAIGFEIKLSR